MDQIKDRTLTKQNKYSELRYGIKRLFGMGEVQQINIVFDFLGGFHKRLLQDLKILSDSQAANIKIAQNCQRWILSQNCEIIKTFSHT